jgi:hypothetical protein
MGLKLSGTDQFMVSAGDVNLLEGNIYTIKGSVEALFHASKKFGLEVNTEKTKYMLLSRQHKSGQNRNIKTGHRPFENVAKFRYLGTTVTIQSFIHEEIKSRLNSDYVCYRSVKDHMSSRLLSKNVKIKTYKKF